MSKYIYIYKYIPVYPDVYTHIYIYTHVFIFPCSLKHDNLDILLCIFENASLIAFVSVLKKLHSEGQGMYGCEVSGKYKAEIHNIVY